VGVGGGARQRESARRCGEVHAPERPKAFLAEEAGGGADLSLVATGQDAELRDYERLPESGEAFIYVAMSRLMARRLSRS
jgi:hypothetical protein